jgi:DNA-directed RNA polymerase specialized sigma24 family protein
MRILQERHRVRLAKYIKYNELPAHWVDDLLQEIWHAFYSQTRWKEIYNVKAYLGGIAKIICAREVLKRDREKICELNADISESDEFNVAWEGNKSIAEVIEADEQRVIQDYQLDLLQQLPFIDSELSDCQRVYWVLRQIYRYPSKTVGRLLGRTANNIDVQTRNARLTIMRYFQSDKFRYDLQGMEQPGVWTPRPQREGAVVVERFAETVIPQFTPDELKPLGLSLTEFQTHYAASLILPRWQVDQEQNLGGITMLLTRKPDWADWQQLCARLEVGEGDVDEFIREECFIDVEVEDGHIVLDVHPLVELIPEGTNQSVSSDNTYLSIHGSKLVIPVILGFLTILSIHRKYWRVGPLLPRRVVSSTNRLLPRCYLPGNVRPG